MAKRYASRKRKIVSVAAAVLCLIIAVAVYTGNDRLSSYFHSAVDTSAKSFNTSKDFVRFLDVGQGDSILIYSNGRSALIDSGTANSANDICEGLKNCGISQIDVFLISHLHADHTGGVSRLTEDFTIKNLVLPELSTYSEGMSAAQNAINAVSKSGGGVYNAKQGMNFNVGEFEITVLASYGDEDDDNNRSLIVMAEIDGAKFLFTGDAEKTAEKRLLNEGLNLDCDVFKAGHHGSNTSNTQELLKATTPEYVAISAGLDNMYGHPHSEVLQSFKEIDATVLRTDQSGDITFYVENGKITADTEK